jgi:hypothetical protein
MDQLNKIRLPSSFPERTESSGTAFTFSVFHQMDAMAFVTKPRLELLEDELLADHNLLYSVLIPICA